MKNTVRVLVVEDNPGDIGLVRAALDEFREAEFDVETVSSTKACRHALETGHYDILLLDYSLPGQNGLDFLKSLSGKANLPPVIMLTGQGDELIAKESIRAGAHDYYAKGRISADGLGRTVLEALARAELEAEERRQHEEAQRRAITDPLTGLHNRQYLEEILERECRRARRYGAALSCLMVDLDGFKECNERFGHIEGDNVLRQVAAILAHGVREIDIASRYGADEFCLLLPETGLEGAMQLAERIRFAVASTDIVAGRHAVPITVSIGVFSPATMNQLRPVTLIEYAEAALRKAKLTGKNRVCEYSQPSVTVA